MGTSCLPVTCKSGTTIRDTSPCTSMWDYPGVCKEEVKWELVWDKEATQ